MTDYSFSLAAAAVETPYETIANAVEEWYEEHGYQTMLVSIALHYDGEKPREITEILEFDLSNMTAVWDSDWWEGEQSVELLGFMPLDSLRLHGRPADVREVKRGKWIVKFPIATCSECGETVDVHGNLNFCPNCGADMRGAE